ncbi:hypothetical protein Q1695_015680 [Nippostrongylus brasiliensis]|nr:hypothetical protein Q1695_015680 [Nippostrongylus brasiliensis]
MTLRNSRFQTPSVPADQPPSGLKEWDKMCTSSETVENNDENKEQVRPSSSTANEQASILKNTNRNSPEEHQKGDVMTLQKQRLANLFVNRLKDGRCVPWKGMHVLDMQLVNYNPSVFDLFVDLPDSDDLQVRMRRPATVEELDITGKSGNLRHAVDVELSWLTDAKLVFNNLNEDVRSCAVMAFAPPRCFVLCDDRFIEDETRVFHISSGLKSVLSRKPLGKPKILPGNPLVGVRSGIYLRVFVLESDENHPMKYRCVCLDVNAIYSFGPEHLHPLPEEFSTHAVATNVFLARFRGTRFVLSDMYEAVDSALCQPNRDEGVVETITCAIYGVSPDNLTVVDACMTNGEKWVSEELIDRGMVALAKNDPDVLLSPLEAEEMLESKRQPVPLWMNDQRSRNNVSYDVREDLRKDKTANDRGDVSHSNDKEDEDVWKTSGEIEWQTDAPKEEEETRVRRDRRLVSLEEQLRSIAADVGQDETSWEESSGTGKRNANAIWTPRPDKVVRTTGDTSWTKKIRDPKRDCNISEEEAPRSRGTHLSNGAKLERTPDSMRSGLSLPDERRDEKPNLKTERKPSAATEHLGTGHPESSTLPSTANCLPSLSFLNSVSNDEKLVDLRRELEQLDIALSCSKVSPGRKTAAIDFLTKSITYVIGDLLVSKVEW